MFWWLFICIIGAEKVIKESNSKKVNSLLDTSNINSGAGSASDIASERGFKAGSLGPIANLEREKEAVREEISVGRSM